MKSTLKRFVGKGIYTSSILDANILNVDVHEDIEIYKIAT